MEIFKSAYTRIIDEIMSRFLGCEVGEKAKTIEYATGHNEAAEITGELTVSTTGRVLMECRNPRTYVEMIPHITAIFGKEEIPKFEELQEGVFLNSSDPSRYETIDRIIKEEGIPSETIVQQAFKKCKKKRLATSSKLR